MSKIHWRKGRSIGGGQVGFLLGGQSPIIHALKIEETSKI